MNDINIKFLGTRGSCPVHGEEFRKYGGATSCVLIRLGTTVIVLDAGTGIMSLPEYLLETDEKIYIFLTHPHIDHLMGIPVCSIFFNPKLTIEILGYAHEGMNIEEQINYFLKPPLWPVDASVFTANVKFVDLALEPFFINDVKVSILNVNHPGGCIAVKLEYFDKKVVYMTDCEITDENFEELQNFVFKASLLISDGQFSDRHKEQFKGYGHSTWNDSAKLAKSSKVSKLAIFHHSPSALDTILEKAEIETQQIFEDSFFAKRREGITI